jgi:2-C-methyl-D-erythritol 2,4-cyclodiphosphate synthase/2-C-methyl-D-erythritol 4-phosphate cytidylyltransferase/2-C-methyl-D-erythritol 2,4-cyclodiphosphate synthase
MRIGLGRDLHPLVPGRAFILGGVVIPAERGEAGHSDGDVLCHALTDALLGGAALGDIGEFFPPDDPRYEGADSLGLLAQAHAKLRASGWEIANIDAVIQCESPKILPYREKIRAALAGALELERSQVFLKAKTGERLGLVGEGLAVEAEAVCLIYRKDEKDK